MVAPTEDTLKISCRYLYRKCVRKGGGSRRGVLGGCWGVLRGHLEERVILDNMDDLGRSQGSYPESFVSLFLVASQQSWRRNSVKAIPCVRPFEIIRYILIILIGLANP